MKRWQKRTDEKAEIEAQNAKILNAFKKRKIKKESGQLTGKELFKPITKRLDKQMQEHEKDEAEGEAPDYGTNEFDRLNPFYEGFRPD